ncbi:hypothetical protein NDU88_008041 [Pleurodeles waltl]|uniref:Uncharacterized protein n=1 Tax=Pleurodeles waltl TaxID=8319 RepID=A0AAV7QNK7_PLEWA|nr:hypothetical protein NDU88_008041 [Pleurodeles waltl]
MLYGPPDQQVSPHQKKGIWRAIAKDVRTLGVYSRRSTHCRKLGGLETLGTEDGRDPAGDGLPARKGCPSNPDPRDGLHTAGGLSRAGWPLGGITATTRG